MPTERPPLLGEVVPTFLADRGCCVVSATDPPGRILGFLDRSRYYFFQVAPQLYSRGWVDPIPEPLPLRKFGSAGNRTQDLCICSQKLWPLDHRGGHNNIPNNLFIYELFVMYPWQQCRIIVVLLMFINEYNNHLVNKILIKQISSSDNVTWHISGWYAVWILLLHCTTDRQQSVLWPSQVGCSWFSSVPLGKFWEVLEIGFSPPCCFQFTIHNHSLISFDAN
jgi:hypothetical protein